MTGKDKNGLPRPMPQPGLDGTYRDSCIVCLEGTDTGLAFTGETEWILAGLERLGIPQEQASVILSEASGCDAGRVPSGVVTESFRVCPSCAKKSGASVGLVATGELPCFAQPGTSPGEDAGEAECAGGCGRKLNMRHVAAGHGSDGWVAARKADGGLVTGDDGHFIVMCPDCAREAAERSD